MKTLFVWILSMVMLFGGQTGYAADTCGVAADIAQKGAAAFAKDKKAGLQLMIKARKLCPDNPSFTYNLGVAWMAYGDPAKAAPLFEEAVKARPSTAAFRNALASALLASGNVSEALTHAQKAVSLDKTKADYADTLCQAAARSGDPASALDIALSSRKAFPDHKGIQKTYETILDTYLADALTKIKQGRDEQNGFAMLKKADFDPAGARAYVLALAGRGKNEEALKAARNAEDRFKGNNRVAGLFDEVMDGRIRKIYQDFSKGKHGTALAESKQLAEAYPRSKAKEAYDKLFNAFISDAATIEIPEPAVASRATPSSQGSRADALLGTMWNGSSDKGEPVSLSVDVDVNIPKSAMARPHGVAVVIGNARYENAGHGIPDVAYAERDAAVMKKYLVSTLGFAENNIIFKTNVSSGDLRTIFGSADNLKGQLHNWCRKDSEVFVYYSGHGAPGADGRAAYLVPVDASIDYIRNTGYALDLFYKSLERLPVKSVTVVLDACFSGDSDGGKLFTNISPALVKNIRPVRAVKNCVIFSAADKDQVSVWNPEKRHGLFTYYFLKGLSGEADKSKDKAITTAEMRDYLGGEVSYWAQRIANRVQTPRMTGDEGVVLTRLK